MSNDSRYKSVVEGKGGIVARVVAKSVSSVTGVTLTTFELDYPRFIHSELMTHRMFSRNAASSRAIPVKKTIEQVRSNPAKPVHWGKNQPGMQAKEEVEGEDKYGNDIKDLIKSRWHESAKIQASFAQEFSDHGLHKQVVNRILEPYVFMKTVLTSTEFKNFYYLRYHEDADPTIAELARVMLIAENQAETETLSPGEWHVPYFSNGYWKESEIGICYEETKEQALKISSSCCAQVSFRVLNDSLEKAEDIYDRLVNSKPVHASPFEHQGTPIEMSIMGSGDWKAWRNIPSLVETWDEGITHTDRDGNLWSGNFKGWIQHRQVIADNVVKG